MTLESIEKLSPTGKMLLTLLLGDLEAYIGDTQDCWSACDRNESLIMVMMESRNTILLDFIRTLSLPKQIIITNFII